MHTENIGNRNSLNLVQLENAKSLKEGEGHLKADHHEIKQTEAGEGQTSILVQLSNLEAVLNHASNAEYFIKYYFLNKFFVVIQTNHVILCIIP